MVEKRIGLIPNATTSSGRGADDTCAILATDRRLIIVFDSPLIGPKQALRRFFGKEADALPATHEQVDLATVDLDQLARAPQNIVIPYFVVEKFTFSMTFRIGSFNATYRNENGKQLMFDAMLVPSDTLIKKRRAEGLRRREIIKQYGEKCRELFKRALPSSISLTLEGKQ